MTDPDVEEVLHEAVCDIWRHANVRAMKEILSDEQIREMEREEFPPPKPNIHDMPKVVRFLKSYAEGCHYQWLFCEKGAEASLYMRKYVGSVLMRPYAFHSPATTHKEDTFMQRRMIPETTFFNVDQEWRMSSLASAMLEEICPVAAERRFLASSFTTCAETLMDVYTTALHVMRKYYTIMWLDRERRKDEAEKAIEVLVLNSGQESEVPLDDLLPLSQELVDAIVPYMLNPVLYEKPGYDWLQGDLHHYVTGMR